MGQAGSDANAAASYDRVFAGVTTDNALRRATVASLATKSFTGLASDLLDRVENTPVTIGAVTLTNLRNQLIAHSARFAALDRQYRTIGEFWRQTGQTPLASVSESNLVASLNIAAQALALRPSIGLVEPVTVASAIVVGGIGTCAVAAVLRCFCPLLAPPWLANREGAAAGLNSDPIAAASPAVLAPLPAEPMLRGTPVIGPHGQCNNGYNQLMVVAIPDARSTAPSAVQAAGLIGTAD